MAASRRSTRASRVLTNLVTERGVSLMKLPRAKFTRGEDVRAFRKKTGMNQALFWERIGITQSGGSRYETGRNIPVTVQILLTIAYGGPAQAQAMTEALRAWKG